jgi:hypothetical protein
MSFRCFEFLLISRRKQLPVIVFRGRKHRFENNPNSLCLAVLQCCEFVVKNHVVSRQFLEHADFILRVRLNVDDALRASSWHQEGDRVDITRNQNG